MNEVLDDVATLAPRAPAMSATHLVLIPSYNSGPKLLETVLRTAEVWNPVWVVIDGSTDGSDRQLAAAVQGDPRIRMMVLEKNQGKGAAVLQGLKAAVEAGFTHVLTLDSDGQHPAEWVPEFMRVSAAQPDALVLGAPVFDASAPLLRVRGRKISNWWADLETLWIGIGDSLFGMRVYPAAALLELMLGQRWMRRFDFDVEAAVRLVWRGLRPVNIPTPVRYFRAEEGGVSHFRYGRDNLLLSWMHTRLFLEFVIRLPRLAGRRKKLRRQFETA